MLVHKRKPNRLLGYNYNLEGYYFITICTQHRIKYFGSIKNNEMILNKYGRIAEKFWQKIPNHYKNVAIDEFIIMPNHIHGIIQIVGAEQCSAPTICSGAEHCSAPTGRNKNYGLLSKMVKSFKEMVVKQIHQKFNDYKFQWQRSFYDHIIRNEKGLYNIREYIINNPLMWNKDRNNV